MAGMFNSKMQEIKQPELPDPVRIPNRDDPDVKAAVARKSQEDSEKRQGRRSTNLSGGNYSRTRLG